MIYINVDKESQISIDHDLWENEIE